MESYRSISVVALVVAAFHSALAAAYLAVFSLAFILLKLLPSKELPTLSCLLLPAVAAAISSGRRTMKITPKTTRDAHLSYEESFSSARLLIGVVMALFVFRPSP